MPSTYTTNLNIEKIGTGEQSGTWGNTTNTNLDLIDQAINGIVSVTLTSSNTTSAYALPITQGTVSEGRNAFIEFIDGGDIGGTGLAELTLSGARKIAYFRNSLSGGRDVTISQAGATFSFLLTNGNDAVLYFNGTTVDQVFKDLKVNNLTTNNDLSVGLNASVGNNLTVSGAFTSTGIDDNATTNQFTLTNSEASFGGLVKSNGGFIVTGTSYGMIANGQFLSAGIDDNATSTALTITNSGIAATLTTAAQPNITSVGTLTGFTSTGIDDNATSTAMTINSSEQIGIGTSPSTTYSEKLQVSNGIRLENTGADFVAGESGGFFGHYDDVSIPGSSIITSYATFCKSYSAVNQLGNSTSGDVVLASGSATGGYAADFITGNATSGDIEIYTGSVSSYGGTATSGTLKLQDQTSKGTIIERDGDVTMKADIIVMSNLPTSDPANAGQLWNDSGTLKVSAG